MAVVPELSERWNWAIVASGSETPELVAAMAGSFHDVISLAKMPAMASGLNTRLSTPSRLYATAIAPPTIGILRASFPSQRSTAAAMSSSTTAASVPAKDTWPETNDSTPAPEPTGW